MIDIDKLEQSAKDVRDRLGKYPSVSARDATAQANAVLALATEVRRLQKIEGVARSCFDDSSRTGLAELRAALERQSE